MPDRNPGNNNNRFNTNNIGRRPTREYRRFQESEEQAEKEETLYERVGEKVSQYYTLDLKQNSLLKDFIEGIKEDIRIGRLDITQEQIGGMLVLPTILLFLLSTILQFTIGGPVALFSWGLPFFWIYWTLTYPSFNATITRIKSSDEALRVTLYMAMQLEMNPNLSGAIENAAGHTSGYLSRDLSKIMWDTETQQVINVKEALSKHMELWREWSQGFVKSMEYLVDSLSRPGEDRRRMIENAQEQMIDSVETRMDQYARNLSSPIRVLNLAGIMLPLMGLIMFPLITVFLGGSKVGVGSLSIYMAFGYLIVLPLFLYFLVKRLISKRPGAYSQPSLENVEDLPPKDKIRVNIFGNAYQLPLLYTAVTVGFIISIPGIIFYFNLIGTILSFETGIQITPQGISTPEQWKAFIENQYQVQNVVPSVVQAMTLFWGINAGLITYFAGRSYGRQKIRDRIQEIEDDIEVGLTELENALSKGQPIERSIYIVIQKFDEMGQGDHPLKGFFQQTFHNMQRKGFPFRRAVFDETEGAIQNYPSNILRNAMQVLANSTSQGPGIASDNLRRIKEYVQNQKSVEETIKRLLDETVSQMEIQAKFIAPVITAAAASMALIIVETLFVISERLKDIQKTLSVGGGNSGQALTEQMALIKNLDSALPPTLILLIVALYLIEVSLILGYFMNGIKNGFDEISRDMVISKTLIYSTTIFSVIVLVAALYVMPVIAGLI